MMNSDEFRRSVYERAAEYKKEQQRRQRIAVKYASVCACFCVLIGVVVGGPYIRQAINNVPVADTTHSTIGSVISEIFDMTTAQTAATVKTEQSENAVTSVKTEQTAAPATSAEVTAKAETTKATEATEPQKIPDDAQNIKYGINFYGDGDEVAIISTFGSEGSPIVSLAVACDDESLSRNGIDSEILSAGYTLPDEAFFADKYLVIVCVRGTQKNVLNDEQLDIITITYGAGDDVNLYLYKIPRGEFSTLKIDVE